MARSFLALLPLCLLPSFFVLGLSATSSSTCPGLVANLTTPCVTYISSPSSAAPSTACCDVVRSAIQSSVVNQTVECLCALSSSDSLPAAEVNRALDLPKACKISANFSSSSSPCDSGTNTRSGSTTNNGTNGNSAGVLSAFGPSYVSVTFTSLLSSLFAGFLI